MTTDHARKKAIRARMDATGETYSTAARKLAGADGDPAGATEVLIARVNSTLASPRARIGLRMDWGSRWGLGRPAGHRPGRVERMATFATKAVVKRISPTAGLASVREKLAGALFHPAGDGFIEPAAARYQMVFGGHAVMQLNGQHYRGPAGTPLQDKHRREDFPDEPLELLRRLRDVTGARLAGHETLRGTPCQVIAARVGSAEFTVWIDDEHIRQVQTVEGGSSERIDLALTKTLELWDFGAEDVSADWTCLPGIPADRKSTVTQ